MHLKSLQRGERAVDIVMSIKGRERRNQQIVILTELNFD
jgi:hypothetical protein